LRRRPARTSIANSIGISILIEIVEKLPEVDGKLASGACADHQEDLRPTPASRSVSAIFADEASAVAEFQPA